MNARPAPEFPSWPQYDDGERTGLIRALEQGRWWRSGSEVDSFESEFADSHGAPHALAVTNGTHALELALQCLGVGPGTEVIVPAFTFISSSRAAQRLGAVAVPVDVDLDTYNTGVALLQDAAHAHGARWQGKRVGELGTVASFSFQNGKLMTAGEGGALLFPDEETYEAAFLRHSCGRPRTDRRNMHQTAGTNIRLNEFSASVLRAQLSRLDAQIALRDQRWTLLSRLLGEIDGVVPQGGDPRADRNSHYMAMFWIPGISEEGLNALVDTLVDAGLAAFRAIYRTDAFWETAAPDTTVEKLAESCPHTEEALYSTAEIIAAAVGAR